MEEQPRGGRPRSERARVAVLHAVDDLLVDVGYAAMTMKGIAERAGVGRQTVYRWWSTKAEILLEACVDDARRELAVPATDTTTEDLTAYLRAVGDFLTRSPAGAGYRALLGEAQHDPGVAALLGGADVLGDSARPVLERAVSRGDVPADAVVDELAALLVGPVFYRVLAGRPPMAAAVATASFLRAVGSGSAVSPPVPPAAARTGRPSPTPTPRGARATR